MVGLSHVALRLLLRDYLPKGAKTLWPTEMLSTYRLPHEDVGKTEETFRAPDETGLVPQILGNEERYIRPSVAALKDWGADGIDINMGCPVSKALRHNYGVALMGDPRYAAQVVSVTCASSDLPVSVKLRAGLQNDLEYLKNFVKGLENAGAQWVTLHPRVAKEGRRGRADWTQIRALKEELQIPVIGNGDIQTDEDVLEMLHMTGCDQVMVGRALLVRPWLLWQVGERLGWPPPSRVSLGERAPRGHEEEGEEYGRSLLRFLTYLRDYFSEEGVLKRFKFFVRMSHGHLEFGHELFRRVTRQTTCADLEQVVSHFFTTPQRLSARSSNRI